MPSNACQRLFEHGRAQTELFQLLDRPVLGGPRRDLTPFERHAVHGLIASAPRECENPLASPADANRVAHYALRMRALDGNRFSCLDVCRGSEHNDC